MSKLDVAVYVTSSRSGATHLTTHERVATLPQPTTLCGLTIRWTLWEEGDETASGHVATCRRCRTIFTGSRT